VSTITVPVRQVVHATPRTRIINLDLSSINLPFRAGQALMVGLQGSPLRKPYSIASAPWEVQNTGVMQVLVQIDDSGALDPHLELAAPGTQLDVEGPFGTFQLPAETDRRPVLFIAGGTGIAPFRSMIMERLARPGAQQVVLVYSVRAPDEFAFRSELDALQRAGRIVPYFTVTRDTTWSGRRGRIDEGLLAEALPSTDANCFVCGPPLLVNESFALLRSIGVSESQIQIEKY
jgi:ferredoxin-NADP reductase